MSKESIVNAKDLHQRTETTKSQNENALTEKVEAALGNLFVDHIRPASDKGQFSVTTILGAATDVETLLVQRLTDLGFTVEAQDAKLFEEPGHTISWQHPKPAKAKAKAAKKSRTSEPGA